MRGTVLYDNRTDASELPSHANRPEFREALEKGSGTTVRRSDTLNKSTFYYALLLPNQTVIRVAKVKSNMLSLFEAFLPGLLAHPVQHRARSFSDKKSCITDRHHGGEYRILHGAALSGAGSLREQNPCPA